MASTTVGGVTTVSSPVVQFLGQDVQLASATGTVGLYGVTPVARQAAIAPATDAASAITQVNLVITALQTIGITL